MNVLSRMILKTLGYSPVASGGFWRSVTEARPGDWQRNIQCDSRGDLMSNSAVYACTTRIANDIAKLPINLVEKKDGIWTIIERESPFWRPLTKPNLVQNRIQFFTQWMLSKLMHGNAYALKERDGSGIVARLYILPAEKVKPLVTPDGSVFYQFSTSKVPGLEDQKQITIPASEIIHDLMNPLFHPLCGVPPLFAAALTATQSHREQDFATVFFANMARPSGILTFPGELTEPKAKQYKEMFETGFSGANVGRIALAGGGAKFEPIGYPAQQSQLLELLKWGVEDIARAFGMPLHKIGAGPVPTSNNVEALNQQYYDDCLQIHLESIELALDEGLGLVDVPAQTIGTEFDLDNLLRMDSATQITSLAEGTGAGIYTINEARFKRNLPKVKGGDSPYLQQQNWALETLAERETPDVAANEAMPTLSPPGTPAGPDADAEADDAKAFTDHLLAGFTRERLLINGS